MEHSDATNVRHEVVVGDNNPHFFHSATEVPRLVVVGEQKLIQSKGCTGVEPGTRERMRAEPGTAAENRDYSAPLRRVPITRSNFQAELD